MQSQAVIRCTPREWFLQGGAPLHHPPPAHLPPRPRRAVAHSQLSRAPPPRAELISAAAGRPCHWSPKHELPLGAINRAQPVQESRSPSPIASAAGCHSLYTAAAALSAYSHPPPLQEDERNPQREALRLRRRGSFALFRYHGCRRLPLLLHLHRLSRCGAVPKELASGIGVCLAARL